MVDNIKELLQKICARETALYPVMEMDKVIGYGEAAVADIISCLNNEVGFPRPDDDLPLTNLSIALYRKRYSIRRLR